ncbi:MAG: hypothetical protein ABR611_02570 [Chthoniobacterales bacterium]
MSERIENLKRAVEWAYHCKAQHTSSTPILEVWGGEVVWDGVVETFELEGHVNARCCYAFPFVQNDQPEVKTVLGLPPIDSPRKAVQAAIAATARKK